MSLSWGGIVQSTLVIQIAMILAPALIMANILTRSTRKALRLNNPGILNLVVAILLAICMHPTYVVFASMVGAEYKLGEQTVSLLTQFDSIVANTSIWNVLIVLALVPAICEELVFRGFVFAGLERNEGQIRAILLSSLFFGLSHGVLQQSITASTIGVLLGWVAYRTRGVGCTIAYHCVHNSISMLMAAHSSRGSAVPSWLSWAMSNDHGQLSYSPFWGTLSIGMSFALIAWIAVRNRDESGAMSKRQSKSVSDLENAFARIRVTGK